MELMIPPGRLDPPVGHETDHALGPADAEIRFVEYGSYACPHCRAANERIAQARDQLGDRVCYAFRHRPLTDNSLAFRVAELAELARTPEAFWSAHIKLMTRSMLLTEDDLVAAATDLGVNDDFALGDNDAVRHARARVEARASGVRFTPTFYINRRRYDGPGTRALSSTRCLARSRTVSVRRPLTSRAGALGGHFAGPRDRGRDRHHELSARAGVRGALAPRARFELGLRSLSEVDPSLGQRRAPPAPAHSGSGARHHTGSANPDGRRLVEDDFAAATAALLNKLNLDGTIEHLVVVSAPSASTSTAT